MTVQMRQMIDHGGGRITAENVDVEVNPADVLTACSAKRIDKIDGDFSTSSITWVDIPGSDLVFDTESMSCFCICLSCYGHAGAGASDEIYVDLELDGVRLGGANGMAINGSSNNHFLGISYLSDGVMPGTHTIKVVCRVNSGTGTVLASSSGTQFTISVRPAAKELT